MKIEPCCLKMCKSKIPIFNCGSASLVLLNGDPWNRIVYLIHKLWIVYSYFMLQQTIVQYIFFSRSADTNLACHFTCKVNIGGLCNARAHLLQSWGYRHVYEYNIEKCLLAYTRSQGSIYRTIEAPVIGLDFATLTCMFTICKTIVYLYVRILHCESPDTDPLIYRGCYNVIIAQVPYT